MLCVACPFMVRVNFVQFPSIAVGNAELVHMIVENIDGTQVTVVVMHLFYTIYSFCLDCQKKKAVRCNAQPILIGALFI